MNYGFLKVASAIPAVQVADCTHNIHEIKRLIDQAESQGAAVVCFPELSITAYTCADLFSQQILLDQSRQALQWLLQNNADSHIVAIVGMPLEVEGLLLNVAVALQGSTLLGIVPKTYLPNYHEFYEQRWFASARHIGQRTIQLCQQSVPLGSHQLLPLSCGGQPGGQQKSTVLIGIELCEDLWSPNPPSTQLALSGAEIIFNLSATNELIAKHQYLRTLLAQQSARCICGYVYSSCGFGESTQDLVYGGNAIILENGAELAHSQRFNIEPQLVVSDIDVELIRNERRTNTTFRESKPTVATAAVTLLPVAEISVEAAQPLNRTIKPHPFVPEQDTARNERCEEIFQIQSMALARRLVHTHAKTLVLGISGGLDSTLALLVCVRTIDILRRPRTDIVGITMPGFGTTDRTYQNALTLMQTLGITIREIPIRDACIQHFNDIGHDINIHDVTYENGQARERTQILMDVANQTNGFVVGTGDLSELALGWATYNADHMSNYGVNCSIPKTLVRHLVSWVAHHSTDPASRTTLLDIIDTPVSPELLPADAEGNIQQKTEDLVGPYELHDFYLYHFMRHGFRPAKLLFMAEHAFAGHYDRPTLLHWLTTFCRRFFTQQFKRSCLPDGPKVGSVSLSPRGDWRMPSDASAAEWLAECQALAEV